MGMTVFKVCLPLLAFLCILQYSEARSFIIDYDNDRFLKDGQPFRYISGSIHYFRVPRLYWKDRLLKMKAGGLNAVEIYVAWNVHEPVRGRYNFEGDADLVSFIELANSIGLLVIARPGPFICAEWEFGGYPAWLLKNTSIVLRSMDNVQYLTYAKSWLSVLLPKLRPLLYSNGGPIITVQVENEYGYYGACDLDYLKFLECVFREFLGNDVVYFTNNGALEFALKCGTIPSLFTTLDFGINKDPVKAFALARKFSPKGPLVNAEFYPGWLDRWSIPHETRPAEAIARTLDKMLSMNASVNFYMYEGGTNFGFMNGGHFFNDSRGLITSITSYDYDAPLTEAGDTTTKFHILRETIARHEKIPSIPIPPNTTKSAYGKVQMTQMFTFLDALPKLSPDGPVNSSFPVTMEQLGQNYGFILYRTQIPPRFAQSNVILNISNLVRDRAIIYVGRLRQATLYRHPKDQTVTLTIDDKLQLDILVENVGRSNQGYADPKGILGNVTLHGSILINWQIYPINLDNLFSATFDIFSYPVESNNGFNAPSFFYGKFSVNSSHDTFLYLPGWSKGQAFVNGFNLGRYWPVIGPQISMFVPANVLSLRPKFASVMLFELDGAPCKSSETCFVEFKDTPSLNGPVHPIL